MTGKSIYSLIFFLVFLVASIFNCSAQLEEKISATYSQKPLLEVVRDLENRSGLRFFYQEEWLSGKTVSASYNNQSLQNILADLFKKNSITFFLREPNFIVLLSDEGTNSVRVDNSLDDRLSIGRIDLEKEYGILSGTVVDGQTSRALESVIVTIEDSDIRFVTLPDGRFEFDLPIGNYLIKFQHPSMVDFTLPIALNSDGNIVVDMFEDVTMLEEVVVSTQAVDQNVSKIISGKEVIDIETIKTIPAFFGEADVFNSVLSLPGVVRVGEGSSGINVRGGGVGQNLILLDNSVIYNPAHLFGFFSTFNADVVSQVNFYKGTVPVEFGGRLSAIMDVEMKSGNKQKLSGSGGVGLINSRIMLEGPIQKDTTTFLMSVRAAYPSYMLRSFEDPAIKNSTTYFGDANVKLDHLINAKNRITATGYWSRDLFDFSDELRYNYGNIAGGIEWNSQITNETYLESTINFTSYDYDFEELADSERASNLSSSVRQLSFNNKFQRDFGKHEITYGANMTFMSIDPGNYTPSSRESNIVPMTIANESGFEGALFVGDSYSITDKLTIYGGIRYSFFTGGKTGLEELYHGAEPRVSANYRISNTSSVKLGYNKMRQYIHFISNTASATPIDLWKLSNSTLRPQVTDQLSLGYFRNFSGNQYETSIEGYYKQTNDLVEFRNNAELFLNEDIENELLQGEGRAYGVELQLKKTSGAVTGWVSYTFSRSMIKVSNSDRSLSINSGDFFPTNFDQPHNFSAFSNFKISRRFSINANFIYNTGRPISFPESIYTVKGVTVADFVERNKYRIPSYHRLDVSFVLGTTLKRKKNIEANWSLSIYNLYGRNNAYSVYFQNDDLSDTPGAFQLSVIARPVVAISYNFKF